MISLSFWTPLHILLSISCCSFWILVVKTRKAISPLSASTPTLPICWQGLGGIPVIMVLFARHSISYPTSSTQQSEHSYGQNSVTPPWTRSTRQILDTLKYSYPVIKHTWHRVSEPESASLRQQWPCLLLQSRCSLTDSPRVPKSHRYYRALRLVSSREVIFIPFSSGRQREEGWSRG